MTVETITKEQFEKFLDTTNCKSGIDWQPLGLIDGEETYIIPLDGQSSIMIRSSIKLDGQSAESGKDSIRLWLVGSDNKSLGSKVSKWTTRLPGWQERTIEVCKTLTEWRGLAGDCPDCNKPKGIFKVKRRTVNQGRIFAKCDEHNHWTWLDQTTYDKSYFAPESHNNGQVIAEIENETNPIEVAGHIEIIELEENDTSNFFNMAQEAMIEAQNEPVIEQEITVTATEKTPNERQAKAIQSPIDANVRMLAGPGAGKTFVIENRYKFLIDNGVNPDNILAVTYSRNMAESMAQRIKTVCPSTNLDQITTLHAFCNRSITKWYQQSMFLNWRKPKDWKVKSEVESIIADIWPQGEEKPNWSEVMSWVDTSKYHAKTSDQSLDYFSENLGAYYGELLHKIRERVDKWLWQHKSLTYADMLYLTEVLIHQDPDFKTWLSNRFKYIIVDEGQDTNYQALRIILEIAKGSDTKVFIVGDTDQSIYGFQGANAELLLELQNVIPDIETTKLDINYRSFDEVIKASSNLIQYNYSELGGPHNQEFFKDASGIKGAGGNIDFQMYSDVLEESQSIAETIQELPDQPKDFFVCARTRAQLGYLEGALVKAEIPYINLSGNSFWNTRHVADVISYLRLAYDTNDSEALGRVSNIASVDHVYTWDDKNGKFKAGDYSPARYCGIEFLRKIRHNFNNIDGLLFGKPGFARDGWRYKTKKSLYELYGPTRAQDLQEFVWSLQGILEQADNVSQIIRVIIDDCYEKWLRSDLDSSEVQWKLDDLVTVIEVAEQYSSVSDFLDYVDKMIKANQDTKEANWDEYVVLSTIHGLKGLERKVVFGMGWCEGEEKGLLPHTFSLVDPPQFGVLPTSGKSPIEDERRLGLVCISRAEKKVYLSGVRQYRDYPMAPSRFVSEMIGENNE
jgi:DNA helicase-2/ATP-dependent DNA helicase PcrA